jgi:peptidoglycan/LPS O-acetylase OafA/YrhL
MPKAVATQTSNSRPYFPELDGVRAVATLMVMAFHFSQDWWHKSFMMMGQTGVDLFFVLSGFLITTILLQAVHGDWHEIRNFYIRRTLRIFPLYYFYLIGSVALGSVVSVWYWFYAQNVVSGFNVPLHGPAHFWSLASEEQFYLVWPFLVLFWPRRWLGCTMWGILALLVVLRFALMPTSLASLALTMTRPDGLVLGGLLAFYYRRGTLLRIKTALAGVAVASLIAILVQWMFTAGTHSPLVQASKFSLATILYASLIGLMLSVGDTPVHRILRSKPARGIGRVSYGMYVYHPFIFYTLPLYLGNVWLPVKGIICLLVAYGVALVSFYGFEKQFTGMKDKFAPEKRFQKVAA